MEADETPITTGPAPEEQSTLAGRMLNVIVSPGEAFDEIKTAPVNNGNWIVPLVLSIIGGIIFVFVMYSQPQILQQIRDAQNERVQKMVQEGKITQQAADQQEQIMERFSSGPFLKAVGAVGVLIMAPIMFFLTALVIWLLGAFVFKGGCGYMKAVEATGLSSIISVISVIVKSLLVVIFANAAMTPGPILLVHQYDKHNPLHAVLSAANVTDLWWVLVLALGLSKISGASFLKCVVWGIALWVLLLVLPMAGFAYIGGK